MKVWLKKIWSWVLTSVWLRKTSFWVLAVIITISASVYQRLTGPTYPMDVEFESNGIAYVLDLPRSHGGETDCSLEIVLPEQFSGKLNCYREVSGPVSLVEI